MGMKPIHGAARRGKHTPEYRAWIDMNRRCYYPKCKDFKHYGGRQPPIVVCDRWRHSFENFLADVGPRPDGLALERKKNDGNYEPGNCEWATQKQQQNNKRNNHRLTWDGRTQTVQQWSDETGIAWTTIRTRLDWGWTVEKTLTMQIDKSKNWRSKR
jgi:hypothetical protein